MRQARVAASVLVGLGLAGGLASVTSAQSRVVVPVIVQAPRAASPRASSVQVTTQTLSPTPGGTSTRITVQDTTGRLLGAAPLPRAGTPGPEVATTRVTVRDTTGRILGVTPRQGAGSPVPGGTSTRITVQDTTGRLLGATPGTRPAAATASSVVVELDRQRTPGTVGAAGLTGGIGAGRQSWTITSDGPIDLPIIILTD